MATPPNVFLWHGLPAACAARRSRKLGTEMLGYLTGSLQVVVDRLVHRLRDMGVQFHLGTAARQLAMRNQTATGIITDHGRLHADQLISTLPTPVLADLVRGPCPDYAATLDSVDYLGAICVILALDRRLSPVYWLNVADPGFDFGGVIEQTNLVGPASYGGRHIVYLSRYLRTDHPLWHMTDRVLVDRQVDQVARLFDRDVKRHLQQTWVFRQRYAAPLSDTGFCHRIPAMRAPSVGSMSRPCRMSILTSAASTTASGSPPPWCRKWASQRLPLPPDSVFPPNTAAPSARATKPASAHPSAAESERKSQRQRQTGKRLTDGRREPGRRTWSVGQEQLRDIVVGWTKVHSTRLSVERC